MSVRRQGRERLRGEVGCREQKLRWILLHNGTGQRKDSVLILNSHPRYNSGLKPPCYQHSHQHQCRHILCSSRLHNLLLVLIISKRTRSNSNTTLPPHHDIHPLTALLLFVFRHLFILLTSSFWMLPSVNQDSSVPLLSTP